MQDEVEDDSVTPEEVLEAALANQEGYRSLFAPSPRATPAPHAGVSGADAWEPVPPSAVLVEPGAKAVRWAHMHKPFTLHCW